MRNLTLVFHHLDTELLGKDVFLVPYHLAKALGFSCTIVYHGTPQNTDLPTEYRGVKLVRCEERFIKASARYVFNHAKEIDLLMMFHFTWRTGLLTKLYKTRNNNGVIYVKSDASMQWTIAPLREIYDRHNIGNYLLRQCYKTLVKHADCISCETQEVMEAFKSLPIGKDMEEKLVMMPNGFDEEHREELNVTPLPFAEKENLIITVGRIGDENKNTMMLLRAIEKLNVKDWKFMFVGGIVNNFDREVEKLVAKRPELAHSISLAGQITDKRKLWEIYSRAKVFVMTSYSEGCSLALHEAYRFGDYIVSTDLSCAQDILRDSPTGTIVRQNDSEALAQILQGIINEEQSVDTTSRDLTRYAYKRTINNINIHLNSLFINHSVSPQRNCSFTEPEQ